MTVAALTFGRCCDRFPQVSPKTKVPQCPKRGCAVLLSTHGMDVTAQRQADCYRPKQGVWVLAPHGRGTHGFNWQGPGHWSALAALDALANRAAAWTEARVALSTPYRVIFTGHSNGGFGAWFVGTHYPDMALGVAPLAGMATMGTTEVRRPAGVPDSLWKVIDSTVEEYRGEGLARNLLGLPFMARTGAEDRVIDPRSTRRMASLLQDAGVDWEEKRSRKGVKLVAKNADATVVELAGKEHWWWDSQEENDGGAMDDPQMRSFWKRAAATEAGGSVGDAAVHFACANPASCGSRRGVRMLQQSLPGLRGSEFTLHRGEGGWQLRTENLARLHVDGAVLSGSSEPLAIEIDGARFESPATEAVFCRDDEAQWHLCGDEATCADAQRPEMAAACCRPPLRSAELAAGPLRRVLAAPFKIVVGTTAPDRTVQDIYRAAAIAFANDWADTGGGVTSIVADSELELAEVKGNLILLGGVRSNSLSRALASEQPFKTLQFDAANPRKRIEGGFEIGRCQFRAAGVGLVSLGPVARGAGGLVATIAGTTAAGFDRAMRLFRSRLFDVNSWQHRLPDWIVAGPSDGKSGQGGELQGVMGAGYWGNDWEYRPDASHLECK